MTTKDLKHIGKKLNKKYKSYETIILQRSYLCEVQREIS
jgi:hypothetical protein